MLLGAKSKIDVYQYEKILRDNLPLLIEKEPVGSTKLLVNLLEKTISLENKFHKHDQEFEDGSYFWRPAIENHPNNSTHGSILDELVVALRNALEDIGKKDFKTLRKCLEVLKEKKFYIFRRLELHLYRLFYKEFLTEIENIVVEYFSKPQLIHEYYLLLKTVFPSLQDATQKKILELIDKGPDPDEFRRTTEQFNTYKKRWRADKLEPIRDHVAPNLQKEYDDIIKELGTSELSSFLFYSTSFMEVEYPSNITDAMNSQTVLQTLRSHVFTKSMFPEEDGTARKFKELVEANPTEYSQYALELISVHPVFIYKFLWGLAEGSKKKQKIHWDEVLSLCEQILNSANGQKYANKLDDIIHYAADLLELNLVHEEHAISFDKRERVWKILEKLVEYSTTNSSWEDDYPSRNFDALTISINSSIGKSMHAVMQYAVWCYYGLKNQGKTPKELVGEVKQLLSKRLDVNIDKSISTHAVFGFSLSNLFILDKDWARQNLPKIFPSGDRSILGDAAWDAYLTQKIYANVFIELKTEYEKRINGLRTQPTDETSQKVRNRLAEHVGLTYLSNIKESDYLFDLFIKKAPRDLVAYCIEFIGRRLEDHKDDGTQPKRDVRELWNKAELKQYPELGWLFVNSTFDKKYNINMLLSLLKETHGRIEPIYHVPEELESYAPELPLETIDCIEKLLFAYQKSWEIYHMQDHVFKIAEIIKNGSNPDAKDKVTRIIDLMGKLGFEKFRNLV